MQSPSPITIREAGVNDAEAVSACLRAAFEIYRAAYTSGAFADTVPIPSEIAARFETMKIFVAARNSTEVLGTISCSAHGGEGHLRGMAVLPEFHGRAIAKQLIATAEAALKTQGCSRVTLDTTAPLRRAILFYERQGFSRSGRLTDYFGMQLVEFAKPL
jgi:ribosomal protein S18 acetylase RimI-like enzyme